MKRTLATLAAALLVAAVAAQPAAPAGPSLAAQVKTLQKQVKSLQAKVKKLRSDVNFVTSETATNYFGDACQTALTADLFAATWSGVNTAVGSTVFTVPSQLDDRGACAYIGVTRVSTAVFTAFASFIKWAATGQARPAFQR